MRVYIAGPMEGHDHYNFPAFDAAKEHVNSLGHIGVCPSSIDRAVWGFDGTFVHTNLPGMTRKTVLGIDFQIIPTCDAIYLLKGWERSGGAIAEYAYAKTLGLKIFFEEGALIADVGALCPRTEYCGRREDLRESGPTIEEKEEHTLKAA